MGRLNGAPIAGFPAVFFAFKGSFRPPPRVRLHTVPPVIFFAFEGSFGQACGLRAPVAGHAFVRCA